MQCGLSGGKRLYQWIITCGKGSSFSKDWVREGSHKSYVVGGIGVWGEWPLLHSPLSKKAYVVYGKGFLVAGYSGGLGLDKLHKLFTQQCTHARTHIDL